ncbi:hypothetical protein [Weissella viridescens]|uniref:hypothetical protein n=1 Tax=Weissella viridescens TaxID=1629 RepID=UPI003AF1F419
MILEIKNGKATIKEFEVMKLTRENLLELFRNIYQNPTCLTQDEETINLLIAQINNPVEAEVTKQILFQLRDFVDNVDILKNEVNSKFPNLFTSGNQGVE